MNGNYHISTSSEAELIALFRAILEAKFYKEPEDLDVSGSAILARVSIRIREELIAADTKDEGLIAESRWRNWLNLGPERREWPLAKSYAVSEWKKA